MNTNKKIPTPEEIEKEFQEFVQQKYGGSVRLINASAGEPAPEAEEEVPEPKKTFDLNLGFDCSIIRVSTQISPRWG